MAGDMPLDNPRWERYCQERLAGKSQRQAMLAAYPSRARWGENAQDVEAHKLEASPKISQRLDNLKSKAAKRATITRAQVLDGMADAFMRANELLALQSVSYSVDEFGESRPTNVTKISQAAITGVSSIGKTLLENLPHDEPDEDREFVRDFGLLLAPPFLAMHRKLAAGAGCDLWIKGGRGSTKSSAVSLEVVRLLEEHADLSAVVFVKRKVDIRDGVYEQVAWALSELGVADEWECPSSTFKMTRRATGQVIVFRGCDDPKKSKSMKAPGRTYFGVQWFEEVDQFAGTGELRTVVQSVTRGAGEDAPFFRFHTFNPPRAKNSWANRETARRIAAGMDVVTANYTDVPVEWISEKFVEDAKALRDADPEAYAHEYMGEPVGFGAEVFPRTEVRPVTDEERRALKYVTFGVDWGFSQDPWVWLEVGYDAKTRTLYIMDELSGRGLTNHETAELVRAKVSAPALGADGEPVRSELPYATVWCDGAEKKSVEDYRTEGIKADAAPKQGVHGVRSGVRWLQNRARIVVDPRCRVASEEFPGYTYELTKDGEPTGMLPDRDNHAIDAVRYACCCLISDRACV